MVRAQHDDGRARQRRQEPRQAAVEELGRLLLVVVRLVVAADASARDRRPGHDPGAHVDRATPDLARVVEGRVRLAGKSPADWVNHVQAWASLGATHIIVETRGSGLAFPQQHLAALQQFKDVVSPVPA